MPTKLDSRRPPVSPSMNGLAIFSMSTGSGAGSDSDE